MRVRTALDPILSRTPGPSAERALLANLLGDACAKLVDANSGFSPRRAIEVGRLLETEGISHYEEPCPFDDFDATRDAPDAEWNARTDLTQINVASVRDYTPYLRNDGCELIFSSTRAGLEDLYVTRIVLP